ncbi:AMP-binding enzyme [Antricoccus suffuscus]|uniref:AMP-binding enzyme n=1 Tax=Antricoccus suffuscus TaxID=1629062 RepID=A0A2T1A1K0_9ACTN|nr:AMP-binding protein [Antricoccus suffuscus]PRZ42404.1 AMP-binding enzyme [Antricoccus suffuscus]
MTADIPTNGIDFDVRVRDLLEEYGDPQACAAELLCDRHPADAVAFTLVEPNLSAKDITYGELRDKSRIFAAALADLGVEQGDAVGVLMGKSEALVVALLGIWRRGAVHVPLFTAFAAPAIALRLTASEAKVVIVDEDQKPKLAPSEDMPDGDWTTVVVGAVADGERSFSELMASYDVDSPGNEACITGGDAPLILLFTSGTTGVPKGVPIPVRALASIHSYLEFAVDLRRSDTFWNAADPGWAYGLFYAIAGPLAIGQPSILLHAGFSPALSWAVMDKFGVTNFAGAPTVYRALRNDPTPIPEGVSLRRASSAGEPLTPDVITWAQEKLGTTVRDHYGQTEQGMMICNCWADGLREDVRPGSMGRPIPGWAPKYSSTAPTRSRLPEPPAGLPSTRRRAR